MEWEGGDQQEWQGEKEGAYDSNQNALCTSMKFQRTSFLNKQTNKQQTQKCSYQKKKNPAVSNAVPYRDVRGSDCRRDRRPQIIYPVTKQNTCPLS